jgi:hypothetical protein
MEKNLMLILLLALLVFLNQYTNKWHINRRHYNAKPICQAGEPLPQPNHYRGFNSYFWDSTTNYDQHVRVRVYSNRAKFFFAKL